MSMDSLTAQGVKPTAVRLLVWRKALEQTVVFTLSDMVEMLPDTDRTSIFRALRTFADHHLLHEIDDGSGQQKYCVCRHLGRSHLGHVHFSCLRCGKTYCIEDQTVPVVHLPDGFVMSDAEYVVKGLCPDCKATMTKGQ